MLKEQSALSALTVLLHFYRMLAKFFQYTALLPFTLAVGSLGQSAHLSTEKVSTVYQFPHNGSWVDNMVFRSDNSLLLTRLDAPEVWSIDTKSGHGELAYEFSNVTSTFGISQIGEDTYAVVAGDFDVETYKPTAGSFSVWKLDFSSYSPGKNQMTKREAVKASKIADLPEAQALNGMARLSENSPLLLISDSPKGAIWKLDMETGKYSVALSDSTMLPSGDGLPLGINGVKALDGYVYYSSTTRQQFCRVQVDRSASAIGPYEVVASGFVPDNFDIASDGTAYIATNTQNSVVTVTPEGRVFLIAGGQLSKDIPGPTSCLLAADGTTLYVGTNGGQVAPIMGSFMEPAKVTVIEL